VPGRRETECGCLPSHFVHRPDAGTVERPVAPQRGRVSEGESVAESVGFEPTVSCPTHDFQSCALVRSASSPGRPRGARRNRMVRLSFVTHVAFVLV
jgi:hypothetical protein